MDNVYAIKPTEKDNENQDKKLIDWKSNEIRNIIQWAANGTKKREERKPEVESADKIFMISDDIENGKETSIKKEENIDQSTSDDDSSCESVQSCDSYLDREELTSAHVIKSASNIRLKELNLDKPLMGDNGVDDCNKK